MVPPVTGGSSARQHRRAKKGSCPISASAEPDCITAGDEHTGRSDKTGTGEWRGSVSASCELGSRHLSGRNEPQASYGVRQELDGLCGFRLPSAPRIGAVLRKALLIEQKGRVHSLIPLKHCFLFLPGQVCQP